jgi:hypothetical protein
MTSVREIGLPAAASQADAVPEPSAGCVRHARLLLVPSPTDDAELGEAVTDFEQIRDFRLTAFGTAGTLGLS